jgi:hypothetical protein
LPCGADDGAVVPVGDESIFGTEAGATPLRTGRVRDPGTGNRIYIWRNRMEIPHVWNLRNS